MRFLRKLLSILRRLWSCLVSDHIRMAVYHSSEIEKKAQLGIISNGELIFVCDTQEVMIYAVGQFHPWPPMKTFKIVNNVSNSTK